MATNGTTRPSVVRPLAGVPELELLDRSRRGDQDAYGELFARHHRFALAVAVSVTSSRSDAEDVVALAVENTLRALARGTGPTERFDHYVAIAIRRLAARRHTGPRARELPMAAEELHQHLTPQPAPISTGAADGPTGEALGTLSAQDRMILWATEVDGWSPLDLSRHLGTTPGAVAARSYRARRRLRSAYLQAVLRQAG